jgi:hypothetical protein
MFSVKHRVGRLVELRVGPGLDVNQAKEFASRTQTVLQLVPRKVVVCTDLRGAHTFAADVAAVFLQLMKGDNPKIERNALVFAKGDESLHLQMERLVRMSEHDARRCFQQVAPAELWLGELLNPAEKAELAQFLHSSQKE